MHTCIEVVGSGLELGNGEFGTIKVRKYPHFVSRAQPPHKLRLETFDELVSAFHSLMGDEDLEFSPELDAPRDFNEELEDEATRSIPVALDLREGGVLGPCSFVGDVAGLSVQTDIRRELLRIDSITFFPDSLPSLAQGSTCSSTQLFKNGELDDSLAMG